MKELVCIQQQPVLTHVHVNHNGPVWIVRVCDVQNQRLLVTIKSILILINASPKDVIVLMMVTELIVEVFDVEWNQVDVTMELYVLMYYTVFVQLVHRELVAPVVRPVMYPYFIRSFSSYLVSVMCPSVKSGYCYNGGICIGGSTCLCGHRSEWSGADCSESSSLILLYNYSLIFCRTMFGKL